MKFSGPRFSVPPCVFEDDLPYASLCLLIFLFSQSSFDGCCAPGYDSMMHALGTRCRNTISANLKLLHRRGWFHFSKRRGNSNKVMWLRLPARFVNSKDTPISVIHAMNG